MSTISYVFVFVFSTHVNGIFMKVFFLGIRYKRIVKTREPSQLHWSSESGRSVTCLFCRPPGEHHDLVYVATSTGDIHKMLVTSEHMIMTINNTRGSEPITSMTLIGLHVIVTTEHTIQSLHTHYCHLVHNCAACVALRSWALCRSSAATADCILRSVASAS